MFYISFFLSLARTNSLEPANFNTVECVGGETVEENNACDEITSALNSILNTGDSFQTCASVPDGSLKYNSISAFSSALNSETLTFDTFSDEDTEKIIRFRTWTSLASGEDILVKINKNNLDKWEVTGVTSDVSRNTLSISWTQNTYTKNTNYNIIKVDLYGTRHWNVILESIGTIWNQAVHYRMNINAITGAPVSIAKIND